MEAEHGESLDLMRQIKQAFDPDNLMNPGKMLPA
jgi:D-lactate dehydrogenase (cytochrome)